MRVPTGTLARKATQAQVWVAPFTEVRSGRKRRALPYRTIKESICSSDSLASVSAEAERLWWRLVVRADDFGCYEARTNVIIGTCLTSMMDNITTDQVHRWLRELASGDKPMIELYEAHGKPYLHLVNWDDHQQRRAKNPKYPLPPSLASRCKQMQADSDNGERTHAIATLTENESEIENENDALSLTPLPPVDDLQIQFAHHYPKPGAWEAVKGYFTALRENGQRLTLTQIKFALTDWNQFPTEIVLESMRKQVASEPRAAPSYAESIMRRLVQEGWTGEPLDRGTSRRDARTHSGSTATNPGDETVDKYSQYVEQ